MRSGPTLIRTKPKNFLCGPLGLATMVPHPNFLRGPIGQRTNRIADAEYRAKKAAPWNAECARTGQRSYIAGCVPS